MCDTLDVNRMGHLVCYMLQEKSRSIIRKNAKMNFRIPGRQL